MIQTTPLLPSLTAAPVPVVPTVNTGAVSTGRANVLQRAADRFERASRKIEAYENGPRHRKTLWVESPATTKEERTRIADAGVAIHEIRPTEVGGTASRADVFALQDAKLSYTLTDPRDLLPIGKFPPADEVYHDYEETVAELKAIASLRPDFVKLFSIGKTIEGRDIWGLQLNHGFDEKKPGAVFIGTHHAREHLSTEVPLMLARYLVENADKPEVQALLADRDVTIIPMLNADGVEYDIAPDRSNPRGYEMWRKNRRKNPNGSYGVDLNRNYPVGFGGSGSSGSTASETYRGPSAFSEPETQAVKAFLERKTNVKTLLSYHTFSELILYPWGHQYDPVPNETDRKIFETVARKMADTNGYTPQQASDLYIASGDTTDWAYKMLGIYAFTFELTPKSQAQGGFYPGPHVIRPTFEKNLWSALYLIGLAGDPSKALKE